MKAKRQAIDLGRFSSFSAMIDFVEINQIVGGKIASNCHRLFSLWCLAMNGTVAAQANSRDSLWVHSIGAISVLLTQRLSIVWASFRRLTFVSLSGERVTPYNPMQLRFFSAPFDQAV
jgi:hypothetical protein